ncbi:MAG TPA: BON domain-containing protein [Polyangiales bacterium]|nr:BON domain-containing protein [Polyangiales bacterium]
MTRTDAELQQAVVRELQWDTRIEEWPISVSVQHGVVTLAGTVANLAARHAAQDAAHRVAGVLDVANDIEVRPAGASARSDAQIAHAVRHALEWNVFVPDKQLQSTVSNGWVTLAGDVEYLRQRDDAEHAVSTLAGVRGVTNEIQVKPHASAFDIQRSIEGALTRRAQREAAGVQVTVEAGQVTVSGIVPSYADKLAILDAARSAAGVQSVQDRLQVDLTTA